MTLELVDAIVERRDPEGGIAGGGAGADFYLLQPEPYYCKSAPFETLDELLLVRGATRELLYGVDANRNGVVDEQEAGQPGLAANYRGQMACGLRKYLTVYSVEPNLSRRGPRLLWGRINVNTAPREVLRCLSGLTDADIDLLIAKRSGGGADLSSLAWVAGTLPPATVQQLSGRITTRSYQFSADIVGVGGNGRSFKRAKYVFDLRSGVPRVIYCQDLTHLGWPLSPALWEALRSGNSVPGLPALAPALENR